jgi:2-phospho-L-lactate guanylyltransferase
LAKSRLASILTQDQREDLAMAMLRHVLKLLADSPDIAGVLTISRDPRVLAEARALGVRTVRESGTPELNASLTRATQISRTWGASATLVLPSDLPLLADEDVKQLVRLARAESMVVLTPDRIEDGTNALLMRPPALIDYSFGPASFNRHRQLAEAAGAHVEVYHSQRVSLDIDTRDDLAYYRAIAGALGEPLIWPELMELSLYN